MSINTRASSLAVTMLSGLVALSNVAKAADAVESDQVSRALSDVKIQAFQLKADADQMETFTRSTVGWAAHTEAISKIKQDVNAMGRLLTKLQESRNSAAVWQRTAIDRIGPVARELASNTTAAIEHLNKNPQHLNSTAYQNYLEAIADSASNLAATTKQRLERLVTKLELPAGA